MSQNAYAPTFEPVVRVGEVVKIIKNQDPKNIHALVRVTYIEPLPEKIHDFGALAAAGSAANAEITDLYVNDSEFAQYRVFLLDDMTMSIHQPPSKNRFSAKSYTHKLSPLTMMIQPQLTTFFMLEDEVTKFTVKNPTNYGRSMHRALFTGWRYCFEPIWTKGDKTPIPQIPATVIPIEGSG